MKNICIALSVLLVSCLSLCLYGQQTFPTNGVYDQREGHYIFTNATIYTAFNQKIEKASLLIKEGKIVEVGKKITPPKDAVVVDLEGKSIYPSFIDLYTNYGIPEAPKSEETRSRRPQPDSKKPGAYSWNQSLNAEYQAAETFSANSKKAAEYRKLGFGSVLSHRMDGISRGSGAIVLLGDEREHLSIIKGNAAHHLSFRKGTSRQNYPSSLMGAIALLRQTYYDSDWYQQGGHQKEKNISLEAWNQLRQLPQIFEVGDKLEALRALRLGTEFGLSYIIKGAGDEYQRLPEFTAGKNKVSFILPINFPDAYDATDPYDAMLVSLSKLKHWELAPSNPGRLAKAGINFALTTHGLKKKQSFLSHIRKAIEHGLSEEAALKALTVTPAQLMGVDQQLGSLEKGKLANFIVTSGNIFEEGTQIHHNWIRGKAHILNEIERPAKEGIYELLINDRSYALHVQGEKNGKQKMHIQVNDSTTIKIKSSAREDFINLSFLPQASSSAVLLSGVPQANGWAGNGTLEDGQWTTWSAVYSKPLPATDKKEKEKTKKKKENHATGPVLYPFTAFGWQELPTQQSYLIKGATVWTNEAEGILENTDVLIQSGKIVKVGKDLTSKEKNITTIDGKGKHLTCGIIDEHSHIAISRGTNEGTQASSAEVRIGDVLNSEDINIYRQLAGGVTTSQILHGSANPIGGQSAIIKLRWGYTPEDLKFKNAAPFIKFALGENVKQSNWGDNFNIRFPQTRMGVEQVFEDYLTRAKSYGQLKASGQPYRRDLDLEALLEVIEGKRFITCHSYQQGEINMLMKVAEQHGFTVNTFTHILEGYKVADKMAKHGAAGSTFSDWWAYKYEVIDAIPYNAAIMHENKVLTGINSDDAEMGRRLNQEAAKAVMYGNVSEEEAWKFVTLNPARMLHIDQYVGSIKEGKDADVVLWSDHPLSIYARAEITFVDGIKFFDRIEDRNKREEVRKERNRIIQNMTEAGKNGAPTQQVKGNRPHHYHCDDIHDEMGEEH